MQLVETKSRHKAGSGVQGNLFEVNKVSADEGRSCSGFSLGLRGGERGKGSSWWYWCPARYVDAQVSVGQGCVLRVGSLGVESLALVITGGKTKQS